MALQSRWVSHFVSASSRSHRRGGQLRPPPLNSGALGGPLVTSETPMSAQYTHCLYLIEARIAITMERATSPRSLLPTIEHLPDLPGQRVRRERLLEKRQPVLEHTVAYDRVVGVA